MSYRDRLRAARYNSPSGQTILFDFKDLERDNAKKANASELPFQNGGVIQQQGNKMLRYPIVAFFYGSNYDITADRMFKALLESGVGTLDHPRWGEIKVVPFSYRQSERFIEEERVSIITISFFEWTDQNSPVSKEEEKSSFLKKLGTFKEFVKLDFLREFKIQNLIEKSTAIREFNSLLSSLEGGLDAIVQTKEEIKNQYDLIINNINRVDGLIEDTETTIASIISLSFLGVEADDNISNISGSYRNILNSYQLTYIPESTRADLNTVYQIQTFGASSVVAIANSIMEYDFSNKSEAISELNELRIAFDSFVEYLDALQEKFENNLVEDNYSISNDTYNLMNELVGIAYSYILNQLYNLKIEQVLVLDKEINPLSLCSELYGTIDKLDDLIADNDLSKYELFLLPIGREIKIYV